MIAARADEDEVVTSLRALEGAPSFLISMMNSMKNEWITSMQPPGLMKMRLEHY